MTLSWRAVLRKKLSSSQRAHLRRGYNAVAKALTISPLLAIFRLFPTAHVARVKEQLRPIGQLDYMPSKIMMYLDGSLQVMRLNSCQKEPETVAWIEQYMLKGDVMYDVGANVGSYSFVAAAVLDGKCEVFALEPSSSTFAALSDNVRLNNLSSVIKPLHVALSNKTELAIFNYSDTSAGAGLHAVGEAIDQVGGGFLPAHRQPILAFRLDDLIEVFDLPVPNHLKIDTDGAELRVIQGAEKMLGMSELRTIFIEVNEGLESCGFMLELLIDQGFNVAERHPAGVSPGFFNYVFVREAVNP